jgi:hypothetical protein
MRRGRLADVLRASVVEHDWDAAPPGLADLVDGRSLAGLPQAAQHHGVAGCVHQSLRGLDGLEDAVRYPLENLTHLATATHLKALGELAVLSDVLGGIPWMVLKGPVLSETYYARPDLRGYGDLDILVPPRAFGAALSALETQGARVLDRNWTRIHAEMRAQVHLRLSFGTLADLHWHLVNHDREPFAIRTDDLLGRARPVSLNGIEVLTLDPVDMLLHVALHACLGGGRRLVWLKDVERVIATDALPWDAVVARALDWGAGDAVATVLARARRTLGADVPNAVLRELARRPRRVVTRTVDRLWPAERSAGRAASPAELVARTAGRGGATAVGQLVRGARLRLAGRPARARHGHLMFAPSGGAGEREAYLAAVHRCEIAGDTLPHRSFPASLAAEGMTSSV